MHVGLALDSPGVLLGIAAYARPARTWTFDHADLTLEGTLGLLEQKPDGIVFSSSNVAIFEALEAAHVPAVNVHFWEPPSTMGSVASDDHAVGVLGASHFLSRGYQRFAYFARTGWPLDARLTGFAETLARSGVSPAVFDGIPPSSAEELGAHDRALCAWLIGLQKPVAILCTNDQLAWHLAERCRRRHLKVPTDVAILGVDNTEFACALADPPLSSVDTGSQRLGYQAAKLLAQMMGGAPPSELRVRVRPVRVIGRGSTDNVVASDPLVSGALRHMKAHLADDEGLEALSGRLHCSRRKLERRFQECLGISPAQAWTRFRLEEAQRLLADTGFKLPHVAELSGFREAKYLSEAFKKLTGQTPGEFRRHASPEAARLPEALELD